MLREIQKKTDFFWHLHGKRGCGVNYLRILSLGINDFCNGSRGRTRTYNHTVNSRVLYH